MGHHPGGGFGPGGGKGRMPQGMGLAKPVSLRRAVVVLGAPKSGKTSLARRISEELPNFKLVTAPLESEKFDMLSEELHNLREGDDSRMIVLDGFGADHDADLFYLSSVLTKFNFAVYGLVYLNLLTPATTIPERQDGMAPNTAQMFAHAVAFETCAQYDGNAKNLILITADQDKDATFREFERAWADAQASPLVVQAPKVLKSIDKSFSWRMESYSDFRQVTQALQKVLPATAASLGCGPQPLRSVFGPLTYGQFARWFTRLPQYNASLMTNGQRVVLFAFNGNLYFLPEHGYYVFRYDPHLSLPSPPGQSRVAQWFNDLALRCDKPEAIAPLVFDAEYVIFQNDEYMLLRDVLVFGSQPTWSLPLAERLEKMTSAQKPRAADTQDGVVNIQILPHRYTPVHSVHEIFTVWQRAESSEGDRGLLANANIQIPQAIDKMPHQTQSLGQIGADG